MAKPFYAVGAYVCEAISQALGETSSGNMQFVLRFKVLGTPDPANPENYMALPQQFERTAYMVINANTIEFVMGQLEALGFDRESFRYLDPKTPGFQDFTGVVFDGWCKHDEYNGETKEKWNVSTKNGALEVKPVDAAKVRQLDALFAAQLKKGAKKNGTATPKPAAAPVPAPAVAADDDVPF